MAVQAAELRGAKEKAAELTLIQSALCAKMRELTAAESSALDHRRAVEEQIAGLQRRIEEGRTELAGLRYAVLEGCRLGARADRGNMHILQQKAASLAEIVSALLSSPLSPAQRRLVASFQNLVEDWTTEQLSTLGSNQLSLMAPNFQAEEFCLAELVRDASQALQQVAAARGIECRTSLSEPSPAKVVGDPSHLGHLMTLLPESCLALSQARRLALQASVDPAKPGPAGLKIDS